MMNKEIKAKWVEALRDGTRTQGKGVLRNSDGGQCCLDVLCELSVDAGIMNPPQLIVSGDDRYNYIFRYIYIFTDEDTGIEMHEGSLLPSIVVYWSGIRYSSPVVTVTKEVIDPEGKIMANKGTKVALDMLNDAFAANFETIADFIEADEEL